MNVMKGLLSRGLKNGNYFIVVFVIGHTINTKGIHREKKNHPTHLQPIAREEVGRGCWRGLCGGVTLVKRAQLQQWVCRGGRGGEGSDGLATAEGFGAEQDAMTSMTKEIMKAS